MHIGIFLLSVTVALQFPLKGLASVTKRNEKKTPQTDCKYVQNTENLKSRLQMLVKPFLVELGFSQKKAMKIVKTVLSRNLMDIT